MGNREARLVDAVGSIEQEIEVEGPGAETGPAPGATERALDRKQPGEQVTRTQLGRDARRRVQETRLLGDADRGRIPKGRDGHDGDPRLPRQLLQRRAQIGLAIAEVRTQADICDRSYSPDPMRRAGSATAVLCALVLAAPSVALASTLARRAAAPARGALGSTEYALVGVRDGITARATVAAAGAQPIAPELGIWRLRTRQAKRVLPRLARLGVLRYAEPDRPQQAANHLGFGDPLAAPQSAWHLYRVGADRAEPPPPGVPLSVVDSGLDMTHMEFKARQNVVPLNAQPTYSWDDPNGLYHGTMVSSVAAAPADGLGTVGVYPQAVLRTYAVAAVAGAPLTGDVVQGLYRAISSGRTVVNLSLSGPSFSQSEYEAIIAAIRKGALVVAAAGNEFEQGSPVEYPASLPHVLTVGATGLGDAPAAFSNASTAVDLAAPGETIPVQHPIDPAMSRLVSGTSFSSPIVAAAAAWIWTVRADLDSTQLVDVLRSSARDVWKTGFDDRTGFGVLDIPAALAHAAPARDLQEPNDDIDQVAPRRLFATGRTPLTTLAKRSTRISARLDAIEDPTDVYRLVVPAHRTLTATVTGTSNMGAILWRAGARTVLGRGVDATRNQLDTSNRPGKRAERVVYRNATRSAMTIYLDVWLARGAGRRATYTVSAAAR